MTTLRERLKKATGESSPFAKRSQAYLKKLADERDKACIRVFDAIGGKNRKDVCALVLNSKKRGKGKKRNSHFSSLHANHLVKDDKKHTMEICISRQEGGLQARAGFELDEVDAAKLSILLDHFLRHQHPRHYKVT